MTTSPASQPAAGTTTVEQQLAGPVEIRVGNRRGPPQQDGRRGTVIWSRMVPKEWLPWLKTGQVQLVNAARFDAIWCYVGEELYWTTAASGAQLGAEVEEALHSGDREILAQREQVTALRSEHRLAEREVALARRELEGVERQVVDARAELAELRRSAAGAREALQVERQQVAEDLRRLGESHAAELERRSAAYAAELQRMRDAATAEQERILTEADRAARARAEESERLMKARVSSIEAVEAVATTMAERLNERTATLLDIENKNAEILSTRQMQDLGTHLRLQNRLHAAFDKVGEPDPPGPPDPIREGFGEFLKAGAKVVVRIDPDKVITRIMKWADAD